MTAMKGDILNRVRRLPKPTKSAEALQPLFEAVSNAMHAVEDCFQAAAESKGRIQVAIQHAKDPLNITISVMDNGIGLDDRRYDAFLTTDTDFKIGRGGKGVGRLMWLDAFAEVTVVSVFKGEDRKKRRRYFKFQLDAKDQIVREKIETTQASSETGTNVIFSGLRAVAYQQKFPTQTATLVKHFGSHFFADFILGHAPQITLSVDGSTHVYPETIMDLRVEDRGSIEIQTEEFGLLKLASFICKKTASADFDGLHQLHFVANGRTVSTRKIDGLIGIGRFGADDYVYHGCVSGEFLDERVNQERTQFNFDESVADDIAKECAKKIREQVLNKEIDAFDGERLVTMKSFISEYPSFHFEEADALLARTPKNAVKPEQFAQALIPIRIRRDNERRVQVQNVVAQLGADAPIPEDFAKAVREAADSVRAEEQRQLTEYVLRRKLVLDVLEVLIRRVREKPAGPDDYHLESTLHQFICPMRVRGDNPAHIESSDHDLWIIDERLAFARYFASDLPLSSLLKVSENGDRPDVLIFDHLHGLGLTDDEPLRRVMLVEFKKPGRSDYDERYSPLNQISRYLSDLVGGQVESFQQERVRIAPDCVFYCYVVADIVGALDIHTSSWRTTSNGRGRWTELSGKYCGSIEVIEWKDLIADARARNRGFIEAAGA